MAKRKRKYFGFGFIIGGLYVLGGAFESNRTSAFGVILLVVGLVILTLSIVASLADKEDLETSDHSHSIDDEESKADPKDGPKYF